MSATVMLWVAGALIGCAAIALAAWALFADRSRGRKRCPKCWYDMSGAAARGDDNAAAALRCPECGHEIKHARQLARTRRRWRWAFAAALLLLAATGCFITGKAKRDGWESVTPTTVLILIVQWSDDPWALATLHERVTETAFADTQITFPFGLMWNWQVRWVLSIDHDRIVNSQDQLVRFSIVSSISALLNSNGRVNIERRHIDSIFRAALRDQDSVIRMYAMESILELPSNDALWADAEVLIDDPDPAVRTSLITELGKRAGESHDASNRLVRVAARADDDLRLLGIHFLRQAAQDNCDVVDVVVAELARIARDDADDGVRSYAAFKLQELQNDGHGDSDAER